jgi:hypothetical protein
MTTRPLPLDYSPPTTEPMTLTGRVHHFFFQPNTANDLGICRILFYGCLFLQYLRTDFASYGDLPPSFYNTLPLFRLLYIPILSVKHLAILEALFKLGLLGACIGRFTRLSTFTAAITGSYLLAVPNNFGRAGHGDGVIIILLWVLAFSHCGDARSLDRRFARVPPPPRSGEYTWPIRMVWVLMSFVYFGAGYTKLHASGLAWVTSDNMAMTFLAHQVNNSNPLSHWCWSLDFHWRSSIAPRGNCGCPECFSPTSAFGFSWAWSSRSSCTHSFSGCRGRDCPCSEKNDPRPNNGRSEEVS